MSKGRVTIPTDKTFFEETKKFVEMWGADAVRDCDGTTLPENADELVGQVYKTYFVSRGDNEYAYANPDKLQNVAMMSKRYVAFEREFTVDLLSGIIEGQMEANPYEHKKYWQVFDRTTGELHDDWEYVGNDKVVIRNAKKMHEYTVNFFARNTWDPTQIYNYMCNGWTCVKDRDIDPVYPDALEKMLKNMDEWLKNNPKISVVRFTTFFYHFFVVSVNGADQILADWHNYAMTASPKMFEKFYETYGYEIALEDIVRQGYYSNVFVVPNKAFSDYRDMVQKFVCETAALFVKKVHDAGKIAMMFDGDHRIGCEPYGKYFPLIGLDAVVGAPSSGENIRQISGIRGVNYTEGRFYPYFFPDTLNDDEKATEYYKNNYASIRRALLREPIDRMGFGGYLKIASKFPKFCQTVAKTTEEFRQIYDLSKGQDAYNAVSVAILNYWGREMSWMTQNVYIDAPTQKNYPYLGVLEALAGLPAKVTFLSFADLQAQDLSSYDVVINYGYAGTAFTGDTEWKNADTVAKIREYVYAGGGFIGIGEPSSVLYGGKFFQLSDCMGVEKETGLTAMYSKNIKVEREHFITADVTGKIDYAGGADDVYPTTATVLDAYYPDAFKSGVNCGHVRMAVNGYGKGRSFYMSGMGKNAENFRLFYRAMLWCAHKENELKKAYSENPNTECHYYTKSGKYAVVNNTDEAQKTKVYDVAGKPQTLTLAPFELRII